MRPLAIAVCCFLLTGSIVHAVEKSPENSRLRLAVGSSQMAHVTELLAGSLAKVSVVRWQENRNDDYEAINETVWAMRDISVLVCEHRQISACDEMWLERLANHGVRVVRVDRNAGQSEERLGEFQLRQAHALLLSLLPAEREQLDSNFRHACDLLQRRNERVGFLPRRE